MKVRIKVLGIGPKKSRLNKTDFSRWEAYTGMTEEQENFFRQTYMDYIMKPVKSRQKHIYFSQN